MSRWLVKELANMTGTSAQTLHHYDHIGLLKPSGHSAKGYRLYNEADLLKLQQIIALKFFGFELKQIKTLLAGRVSMEEHFLAQASFLDAKAKALLAASAVLKKVLQDTSGTSSLPWQSIINLIEVYGMTENLEHAWVKEILTPEELKQYVQFEAGLKTRFSQSENDQFHQEWASLVSEIKTRIHDDPAAQASMELAKRVMALINQLYGDNHANLRHIIWEKGFKEGHANQHAMSKEMIAWLDAALYAYYSEQIYSWLTSEDLSSLAQQWQVLMKEIFADNHHLEIDAVYKILANPKVSTKAKCWLRAKYNLA